MSVRFEALALVNWLLDAEPPKPQPAPQPPKGWVRLLPASSWRIFRKHGVKRFMERVDEADEDDFIAAFQKLHSSTIYVPPTDHWVLKMPNGYGIFGEKDEGASVCEKRRIL